MVVVGFYRKRLSLREGIRGVNSLDSTGFRDAKRGVGSSAAADEAAAVADGAAAAA